MEESILTSIKKMLGIADEYTNFDTDIVIHINTAFTNLNQIGVGPKEGFVIKDNTTKWKDYLTTEEEYKKFNSIETYIYLKVKIVFDPPLNSSVLESLKQTIKELEWRLNIEAE